MGIGLSILLNLAASIHNTAIIMVMAEGMQVNILANQDIPCPHAPLAPIAPTSDSLIDRER